MPQILFITSITLKVITKILKFVRNVTLRVAAVLLLVWVYIAQPSFKSNEPAKLDVDEARLQEIVKKLSINATIFQK